MEKNLFKLTEEILLDLKLFKFHKINTEIHKLQSQYNMHVQYFNLEL